MKNNPLKTYTLDNPLKSNNEQNKKNDKITDELKHRIKLIEKAFKK